MLDIPKIKQKLLDRSYLLSNGCWEWQGCCGSHGYPMFSIKRQAVCAHRISFEIFNGEIPEGMFVCHTCDYRKCINPEHLFLGTALDNSRDMVAKGRDKFDINRKLSDDKARQIKAKFFEGISNYEIARMFDTSTATISRIGNGHSYWWV